MPSLLFTKRKPCCGADHVFNLVRLADTRSDANQIHTRVDCACVPSHPTTALKKIIKEIFLFKAIKGHLTAVSLKM